jgi:hypothetical protein
VTHLQARLFAIAWRTIAIGVCFAGIWCSWNLARADYLFRQNKEQSVRAAIRLEPDAWEYYMRLSLLDDGHAEQILETALTLDPYNAQADIELGLRIEAAGDYERAEKLLLNAYSIDRTFLPRWSLANFYLRRGNLPAFWTWARSAAEMSSDNAEPLFALCWRVSPDPGELSRKILNDDPKLLRQYLDFLLAQNQINAASEIAHRIAGVGNPAADGPRIFSVINRLVVAHEGNAASALWKDVRERHWTVADPGVPNNPNFARDPLPISFDWQLLSYSGLHSWPGPSGLEVEFSGDQPENCRIAEQVVVLSQGGYEMDYSYHTSDIAPHTGLRWQIITADSEALLAESTDLSSESLIAAKVPFTVPAKESLILLRLEYTRTLGTPRISGTLVIPSLHVYSRP